MKRKNIILTSIAVFLAVALCACGVASNESESDSEATTDSIAEARDVPDEEAADDDSSPADTDTTVKFSDNLPEEVMALLKEHKLSVDDNPVIGEYQTTSGCIMVLLEGGKYTWQDKPDDPNVIRGTYEIFEGTLDGREDSSDTYTLESETGPIYTVIITFDEGQDSVEGTIQVFDYQNDNLYYVSDLLTGHWFEANRS